jgi:4-aminobutyrate aminotransferase
VADAFTGLSLSTFGGNPISMAATEATIDVMQREDAPRRAAERGAQLRAHLESFKEKYPFIGDVRGMGLMQAMELVEDRDSKTPATGNVDQLMEATKRRGLLIGKGGLYGNVMRIAPSMLISAADIDEGVRLLDAALAEID